MEITRRADLEAHLMTSASPEPPTLRSMPSVAVAAAAAASSTRRSYSCYNCNYSFHITPTASTSAASPSSFRCPCCHHRHLIPHHTISPPPPPLSSPPPPPPPPTTLLPRNSDSVSDSNIFLYQSDDDESDSDEDYDSDNSLLSFTNPPLHSLTPALKSFVSSLRIKTFSPNSTLTLQSCSICMEDFEINPDTSAIVNELPCEHYFHKDCIVEWLQRSNTCPLCRYKLPVDTSEGEVNSPATNQWEVEFDAILVHLAPLREPTLGRVGGEGRVDEEESLGSNSAALGSDRLVSNMNGGEIGGLEFDAMRDEDGDTLMVDA